VGLFKLQQQPKKQSYYLKVELDHCKCILPILGEGERGGGQGREKEGGGGGREEIVTYAKKVENQII
jgi:hypothetical protein